MVLKFGPGFARRLRRSARARATDGTRRDGRRIAGKLMYLWRASITRARFSTCWFSAGATRRAALRLMRKLLKKQGFTPKLLTTTSWALRLDFRHLP